MKYELLSYPTHFLKKGGSAARKKNLECRTKQFNKFAQRNVINTLFITNKAKNILKGTVRASVATQFTVKVRGSFFMFVDLVCISTNIEFTVP